MADGETLITPDTCPRWPRRGTFAQLGAAWLRPVNPLILPRRLGSPAGKAGVRPSFRLRRFGLWRNPGDDLEITAVGHHGRPTQTKALTCISGKAHRSAALQGLIRDEEAAGSNPATPTQVTGHSPTKEVAFFFAYSCKVQQRLPARLSPKPLERLERLREGAPGPQAGGGTKQALIGLGRLHHDVTASRPGCQLGGDGGSRVAFAARPTS
jgi:hypothetical protein